MALKKRNKASASFSMSSMTDLVFLLLIFFMITSTVVTPSAIKLLLPQSSSQASAKPLTRVYIDSNINFYVAEGKNQERQVAFEDIEPFLQSVVLAEPEMYIALYADESVPYREIVKVLNIANKNKFKLVIATRPVRE
jgi:biopolymer transport protein ExbD